MGSILWTGGHNVRVARGRHGIVIESLKRRMPRMFIPAREHWKVIGKAIFCDIEELAGGYTIGFDGGMRLSIGGKLVK